MAQTDIFNPLRGRQNDRWVQRDLFLKRKRALPRNISEWGCKFAKIFYKYRSDNVLATENKRAIINHVIEIEAGVYLYKFKQIQLITTKDASSKYPAF